jgi:hypothetical protein
MAAHFDTAPYPRRLPSCPNRALMCYAPLARLNQTPAHEIAARTSRVPRSPSVGLRRDRPLVLQFEKLAEFMGETIQNTKGGRRSGAGRPATGCDPVRTIRISNAVMARVDSWASRQEDQPGRSEAFRRLVELGLILDRLQYLEDMSAKLLTTIRKPPATDSVLSPLPPPANKQ